MVNSLAIDPSSTVYAGITYSSGVTNTLHKFDGANWVPVGGALINSTVHKVLLGCDSILYVGGEFSYIGTLRADRIARYEPDTLIATRVTTENPDGSKTVVFTMGGVTVTNNISVDGNTQVIT